MDALPSSIEAYLREAGFSGTEILILRKLLEADALRLRDLAIKTGKSSGVLDQALKKLLRKGIIAREIINESPKYTLHSLQAVRRWMEEDVRKKREMLLRKQRDFDSFIATIAKGKERPDMQYFETAEGIEQAYTLLLEKGKEFLQYLPITCKEEEDPLRDFRVQYFRERRRKGIFLRIIAHDTPLGRRFRSRDIFEYRKTMLVQPAEYPFAFEQIIVGGTIACFDHAKKRACFVEFPQLAESHRLLFESLWRAAEHGRKFTKEELSAAPAAPPQPPAISLETRTLSALREFLLSRRSMAIMGLSALLAASITYGLYQRNLSLNLSRIQERVQAIATTGALQIDPTDLAALQVEEDWKKPQWAKVVNQLKDMRVQNDDILFVYIFRKSTRVPSQLEFVSDSHSLNPYANTDDDPTNNVDTNSDGITSGPDVLIWPGYVYPEPPEGAFPAFGGPTASEIYTDSWGSVASGYAPIRTAEGETVAVLAVDMRAEKLQELSSESFRPIVYFVLLFFAFLLIRLAAFNRPLLKELLQAFHVRSLAMLVALALILSAAVTYGLYRYSVYLHFERMQEQVKAVAATGSFQFDAEDLEALQVEEDWKKPQWKKVVQQLINIRENNDDVVFAYILRRAADPTRIEFVADSHSLNPYAKIDLDGNGVIDDADALTPPGMPYKDVPGEAFAGYEGPVTNKDLYEDQWGVLLSGYAPIRNQIGAPVAVLAIDMRAEKLSEFTRKNFDLLLSLIIFFVLFLTVEIAALNPALLKKVPQLLQRRIVLLSLLVFSFLALVFTYGIYLYTLKLMERAVGTSMMSIAAAAVPRFKTEDLVVLRRAGDMRRPEYQRVFKVLNEIRDSSKDIKFVYILRPTEQQGVWEFVADADSNYNLPVVGVDHNKDGILDEADENIWPGVGYDVQHSSPEMYREGLIHPMYELNAAPDQWGSFITGSVPIVDRNRSAVAVLGIDVDIDVLRVEIFDRFKMWLLLEGLVLLFLAVFASRLFPRFLSRLRVTSRVAIGI